VEGYPTNWLFHIHGYLYNRKVVGVVIPTPTNPLLSIFIFYYIHLIDFIHSITYIHVCLMSNNTCM
jgi:hypothetical protein